MSESLALGSGSEVKDALDVQAYFLGAECPSPSCPWIWFGGERRTGRSGLFRRSRMSESLALGSGSEVKDALDVQAYFRGAECLSPSCPWIWFRGERRTGRSGLFRRSRMSGSLV
ncbi:Nonribosomal peptide synthetase sirP [Clarias magur]|uniref:Nonribosomal peptide synthetase sirP n=1 Tax=Clarias magur TaxID=1594786 RepID=A0A8J4T9L4_CLAMG|nr:Nonribosomal peptide synthetase sirP [Clarias magur]